MWQVLPNLYLGDREDSRDLAALKARRINRVVNCAKELPCCFPGELQYLALGLSDPDAQFITRMPVAMKFIDDGRKTGGVLVHCTAGVSRSAAVVLNYLCHLGRPLEEACAELSRAVLTGIDDAFLLQIARDQRSELSKSQLKRLSLVLAGR